jgi:hypothetical protein
MDMTRVRTQSLVEDVAADLLKEGDALAERAAEQVHRDLPVFGEGSLDRAGTVAAIRGNYELGLGLLRDGWQLDEARAPAPAVARAREFAQRGIELPFLLRAYRIGYEVFRAAFVERLRSSDAPAEAMLDALIRIESDVGAYLDAVMDDLTRIYGEERERWVRSAEAARTETVCEILDGGRLDPGEAGKRLRHRLDRPQLGFVVWVDPEQSDEPMLEPAARELAGRVGSEPLLVKLEGQVLAGWLGGSVAEDAVERLAGGPLGTLAAGSARAAVGAPAPGIEGFRATHRDAMRARRVAQLAGRPPGSVTAYESVVLPSLMSGDPDHARNFVERTLGPLAGDDDTALRLSATLRVYLEEGRSRVGAARRLGIHQNTVVYRVKQAAEMLELDLDRHRLEVQVALALAPTLR